MLRLIFRLPFVIQFGIAAPRHQNFRARCAVSYISDIPLRIVIRQRKNPLHIQRGLHGFARHCKAALRAIPEANPVHGHAPPL